MSRRRKLRIGIIGLGIGMRHASSFAQVPEAEIVAMADPAPARLGIQPDEFCAHYGATYYEDGFGMIDRVELDAISICTSPRLHRPLVEAAARRGLHCLVEKPMAGTVEDCDAMIEACRKAGVQLHMEFPMRQLEPMVELRRLAAEGTFGRLFLLNGEYVCGPRPGPPWIWVMGDGSSVINENTCHVIDSAVCLLGPVERVFAEGGNNIGHGAPVEDTAAFTLHFRSGAVATIIGGGVSTNELGIRPRLSLYGTTGQAYVEGIYHTYHKLMWATRDGELIERDYGAPAGVSAAGGPYGRYPLLEPALRNFVHDILDGNPARASAEDGRHNVAICLAVLQSIRTGKPVTLSD